MDRTQDGNEATDFEDDLDPISREAVTWFAIMHADSITPSDRAAFRAWMRRDPGHRAAYADVERLWAAMPDLPLVKAERRAKRITMTRRVFGQAAIATALGGSAWVLHRQHLMADYRTGTGERRTVTLPDSSRVELAAATAFSLDFQPQTRVVRFHQGEAFFSVAPEQARPFVVEAGAGRIMTAGSSFNVDYESDEEVSVTAVGQAVNLRLGATGLRLDPGHQVAYSQDRIGVPRSSDPATALAWRDGRLVFVSVPFGRVIASLNRWRPGKLVVIGSALAARPVTLLVDITKADVMATLENALPIRLVSITPYLTFIYAA